MLIQKSRFPIKEILFVGLLPSFLKKSIYQIRGYKIGANVSFAISNGTGLTDGLLKIAFTKGRLTAQPMVVREKYMAIRLQIEILRPTAGFAGTEILYADTLDGTY